MARILVVGSGAREHCLSWKLKQSEKVDVVFVAPGNGGTQKEQDSLISGNDIPDVNNFTALAVWCQKNQINLVVVGPEIPLSEGIVEVMQEHGVLCFGPSSKAAEIESNKSFAKEFMIRHGIPTARYEIFTDCETACHHINTAPYRALVVKASGLAAGKGVVVAKNKIEACEAVRNMLNNGQFGDAGSTVVVEELLEGEEFSILCFSDGCHVKVMPPVQDNKRVGEGNVGANTGGMGAYCPCPQVSEEMVQFIKSEVLERAVRGLNLEGRTFKGILYAGVMVTKDGVKVLEFNCRFGDPECQVILPLLETDLFSIMMSCVKGHLNSIDLQWRQNSFSVAVVICSRGYPGVCEKGKIITGLENITSSDAVIFEAGTSYDSAASQKVTSGGRVLTVVATTKSLEKSNEKALDAAGKIVFEGAFYRRDIAKNGINFLERNPNLTYDNCGVSIKKGDSLVKQISSDVRNTARPGSNPELGGFGGSFDLEKAGYKNPMLVSGTDGVGTKLLLAQKMKKCCDIGVDLVAMCANDVLTHNAESLFFLDYYACGSLTLDVAREVVSGIARGCKMAGCALIGGETAEMPGVYPTGSYDLAGFVVGAYEKGRDRPLPCLEEVIPGDVIIGVMSSGIHSNGYSLVRRVVEISGLELNDPAPFEEGKSLGESLLTPTAIYSKLLLPVLRSTNQIRAVAHITGGGIVGNLKRVLPSNMAAILDARSWPLQSVFGWIASVGNLHTDEMLKTFNCGLGLCIVTSQSTADDVIMKCNDALSSINLKSYKVGKVVLKKENTESVAVNHLTEMLYKSYSHKTPKLTNGIASGDHGKNGSKTSVAILISGTGSNMQALIDHSTHNECLYQVKFVISNKPNAPGLLKAQSAGILTKVIDHKEFKTRELFDRQVDAALTINNIEIICLAGFMRLLSGWMVKKWRGQILNIHPSLLPLFKGIDAHKQALDAGVRISGCSVHFVVEEMDEGAIIEQGTVRVEPKDDITSLQEKIKLVEHKVFPKALDLVATGMASLHSSKNKVVWKN
uniref:trifunctional purine biosynthetic protein adenosine-3-like n=1 Tax=Ciona intestinalis TaxID=7719 RepID=UPI0005217340|nr:trifunctional purine biosynthetic protein adenosine-3-like [Ciona intestinalis]|eukprot:XP_009860477.1 trifunctional purine biosynthetic protein adenosine-3-like [Ciona intestinalis]